jgi:ribosomal protein S18 acetylase RimI-like enzyme
VIEVVTDETLDEVIPLIRRYQEFYGVTEISVEINRAFFLQFGERQSKGCQFLFREGGQAVAFSTVYFTYASTIAAKVAVLSDLYTLPENRGKGIGKQLIEHCRKYAFKKGAVRLQWVTAVNNRQAQRLYDSLDITKSTWCFYTYKTTP